MGEKPDRSDGLARTAYHEAGHAVAALALGVAVRRVSVVPEERTGRLGSCTHYPRTRYLVLLRRGRHDQARLRAEKDIVIHFAGPLAERKFSGRADRAGARSDHARIADLARRVTCGERATRLFVNWLRAWAQDLLDLPEHWAAVEALAADLLEHGAVSGGRALELYSRATTD